MREGDIDNVSDIRNMMWWRNEAMVCANVRNKGSTTASLKDSVKDETLAIILKQSVTVFPLRFSVNRRIFVVGFGLYGSIHGPTDYQVNIQVLLWSQY